jgi:hypothetical protein
MFYLLIDGDSTPFEVTASVNSSINLLKQLVQENRKYGALRDFDATDLALWKVSHLAVSVDTAADESWQLKEPEPVEPDDTLVERIKSRGDSLKTFATRLGVGREVSEVFSQHPPKGHLHIIVQRPPPASKCGSRRFRTMLTMSSRIPCIVEHLIPSPHRPLVLSPLESLLLSLPDVISDPVHRRTPRPVSAPTACPLSS